MPSRINRRQLGADDFERLSASTVHLNDTGRRTGIAAYQRRKKVEVPHRVPKRKVPLGLAPHAQTRLLARHLRGDLRDYSPFPAAGRDMELLVKTM